MSAARDRTTVDRFVQTLQLRNPRSVKVYRCILNRFQRFAAALPEPFSENTIRAWLNARLREWPLHLVYHRARLVDRFLEWMVASQVIASNPFAQWRQQYGQRTTPIVRALLSLDAAAMERLRPLPPFGSFLGQMLRAHVARMQSLGYRYDTDRARLLRFDRFLQRRADLSGQPLRVLLQAWAATGSGVHHAWECQACGRAVSKAWHRLDPTVEIVRVDHQLARQVAQHHRRPYICTTQDIRRILETARTFPSPKAPLRPLSLYTMVVLAACAGLRLGEIARLTVGDVHVNDGTIEIRETKFFKSRRLPLAPSVIAALTAYLEARQQAGAPTQASAGLFWHQQHGGGPYSRVMIEKLLVRVLRRVGLKPARGKAGPRVHDLRHAFVVNRMRTWYQEGVNPQPRLPYLATYLGHKDIHSTLVYLTITQDLLQQASERFRLHRRSQVRPEGGHV
jgi:integrase/recombinase XerD